MTYEYKCEVTAFDYWKLTMRQTYRSMAGMCNLVFTAAMILLAAKFWNQSGNFTQAVMLFGCLLFPVIQPIGIYMKSKAQAAAVPKDVTLKFDDSGLFVTAGTKHEHIRWEKIKKVVREPGMVVVFSDARHGYLLMNRVLGEEKDAFLAFAESKIGQK